MPTIGLVTRLAGVVFYMIAIAFGGHQAVVSPDHEFELRVGEHAQISDDGLTVGFEEVVDDSRCPTDTTCFWAGDAVVRLRVRRSEDESFTLDLHTHSNGPREGEVREYHVRLVRVAPVREDSSKIPAEKYVITLVVSRR